MDEKEIKEAQARVTEIWSEMEPVITGTGVSSLIEELVELEIKLEQESNK